MRNNRGADIGDGRVQTPGSSRRADRRPRPAACSARWPDRQVDVFCWWQSLRPQCGAAHGATGPPAGSRGRRAGDRGQAALYRLRQQGRGDPPELAVPRARSPGTTSPAPSFQEVRGGSFTAEAPVAGAATSVADRSRLPSRTPLSIRLIRGGDPDRASPRREFRNAAWSRPPGRGDTMITDSQATLIAETHPPAPGRGCGRRRHAEGAGGRERRATCAAPPTGARSPKRLAPLALNPRRASVFFSLEFPRAPAGPFLPPPDGSVGVFFP